MRNSQVSEVRNPRTRRLGFGALLFAMPIFVACQSATPASRCFLVELRHEEGGEALPLLDAFADANGLVADRSQHDATRYQLLNGNKLVAEVSYRIGAGESGAELAYFQYREGFGDEVLASFDTFVDGTISKGFPTKQCSDVQGYSMPTANGENK